MCWIYVVGSWAVGKCRGDAFLGKSLGCSFVKFLNCTKEGVLLNFVSRGVESGVSFVDYLKLLFLTAGGER